MLYYGILFHGIPAQRINAFVREILCIRAAHVRNSALYSEAAGDFAYHDAVDLAAHFADPKSACRFLADDILFHRVYHDAVCLIGHEQDRLWMECSLPETEFPAEEIPQLNAWFRSMVQQGFFARAEIFEDDE